MPPHVSHDIYGSSGLMMPPHRPVDSAKMMPVPFASMPAHGYHPPSKIRVSVRCLSADLSRQEHVGFAIESSAKLTDLLEMAQNRVRSVCPDDLVELFYADCPGRLELNDVVGEVLTTDALTLVAAASDAWMCPPPICASGFSVPDENIDLERQDPIIGIRLVTDNHPPMSPSDMVLNPGDKVKVLKSEITLEGEQIICCQNSDGEEAWFPANVITAQKVLQEFQSSEECLDYDKQKLSVAVGDLVYHCSSANGWIFCESINTVEAGWVPEWAFTRLRPKQGREHAAAMRRTPIDSTELAATHTRHPSSSSSKASSSVAPWWKLHRQKTENIPAEKSSQWEDSKSRPSKGTVTESSTARSRPVKRKGDEVANGCIRKVCGRSAMFVDQLQLYMRDGSVQTFGGEGGNESPVFRLLADELITSVAQVERGQYLGASVTFETTKGQTIEIKGWTGTGRKWNTHTFTAPSGQQICSLEFEDSRLTYVDTLQADGKGASRRFAIGEENDNQDRSHRSASPWKSSRRRPVEIPPPIEH